MSRDRPQECRSFRLAVARLDFFRVNGRSISNRWSNVPCVLYGRPGGRGARLQAAARGLGRNGGTRLRVDHCQKEGIFRRRRPFLFTRWNDEVRDSFVPSPVTVRRTRRWFTSVEFLPEPRWDVPVWERFLGARNWVSNKVSDSSGSRINFIFGRNEKFGDCC